MLSKEKVGTTIYRTPEMDSIGAIQSYKADVYSFGIMCSKILSGQCPFEGIQKCELQNKVKRGLRPHMPINFIGLVLLINECWNWDAHKRPEFPKICERLKKLKIDILTNTFHAVKPTYDNMVPQTNISSIVKSEGFSNYDELNKEVCISNPNALSYELTFTLKKNLMYCENFLYTQINLNVWVKKSIMCFNDPCRIE